MGTQALHLNKMDRIPFVVNRGLVTLEIEYPTDEDIDKLPMVVLTNEHYKQSDAQGPEDEAVAGLVLDARNVVCQVSLDTAGFVPDFRAPFLYRDDFEMGV